MGKTGATGAQGLRGATGAAKKEGCAHKAKRHLGQMIMDMAIMSASSGDCDGDASAVAAKAANASAPAATSAPAPAGEQTTYSEEQPPPAPGKFWDDTTLMLRNLPNKITQRRLLERVQDYLYDIDFLYLPTDFENKCNLGYAFINFRNGAAADKFMERFDRTRLIGFRRSQKVLAVQPARVQGLAANIRRFRNSSVMGVLTEEEKPLLLREGVPVPFPKPDGPLPPVGQRYARDGR